VANRSRTFALVGPGRAGLAVAHRLLAAGGRAVGVAGRAPDAPSTVAAARALAAEPRTVTTAGRGADLLVVATPDDAVAGAAAAAVGSLPPGALVVHLAGSRGVDVFSTAAGARPDLRYGALHPLVTVPTPDPAHLDGGWCAVAGDPGVYDVAADLGLEPFAIAEERRGAYHAAAAVAANHLVALLGQVERLAGAAGVPAEAFAPLARGALQNAVTLGARAALTGPVARGDVRTVTAHLAALPVEERDTYRALAAEALALSGREDPDLAARLSR
jgi:predicted short-subunit dehydrogenase-like oxidoreductase (DUF2520 family)